ncbi:Tyrosine-protein kinase [Parasponia andersonii]|uniref:Tyrosine-protein kinase n=1 Tax=Parasponia andersonii TaxID=3476 RepID=A0A2P5BNJ0_PARAD|nr:Tyrosine-protein kinase [Parasponia andersonii]
MSLKQPQGVSSGRLLQHGYGGALESNINLDLWYFGFEGDDMRDFFKKIEDAKRYLGHLVHPRRSFVEEFPKIHSEAVDLVEKMLTFDPSRKIAVEDALAHPYLTSLHDITDELACPFVFEYFDQYNALTEEQVKEMIYNERGFGI